MNKRIVSQHLHGRPYFFHDAVDRILFYSVMFSVGLVLVRVLHSRSTLFLSLVWNLFLAWLPYCLSSLPGRYALTRFRVIFLGVSFALWLLFIPNAFYILTDLFHLEDGQNDGATPLWFDLVLIVSFAWNGLIMGILSVRQMEKRLGVLVNPRFDYLFVFPVMWLNGLGVYIGRYLRYNSWDLFLNPFDLTRDIMHILAHPLQYRAAWAMISSFATLLTFVYLTLKRLSGSRFVYTAP